MANVETGEHMDGPLAGIRIIEFGQMIAVPAATHLLATQGASVIKVENATGGDDLRRYGSQKNGMSGWFANSNAGKRSIGLDLSDDEATAVLWELIETADVFIEGFRPGVVGRLGFGWEEAHKRNPQLVYVSSSGFGPWGPYADRPVYDPVIQALAGWAAGQSTSEGPTLIRGMVADKVAALTTAQAITSALVGRSVSGEGRRLEISMLEANLAFNWPDVMMHATLLDDDALHLPNLLQYYQLFKCSDGWISITAGTDSQWQGICNALDRPELATDERFATAAARGADFENYYAAFGEMLSAFTVDEALERAQGADVPAVPVLDPAEVADNEHVVAVGAVAEVDHPVLGRMRMPQQGARLGDVTELLPAPTHGQHTVEILSDLGRTPEQIADMKERGAAK